MIKGGNEKGSGDNGGDGGGVMMISMHFIKVFSLNSKAWRGRQEIFNKFKHHSKRVGVLKDTRTKIYISENSPPPPQKDHIFLDRQPWCDHYIQEVQTVKRHREKDQFFTSYIYIYISTVEKYDKYLSFSQARVEKEKNAWIPISSRSSHQRCPICPPNGQADRFLSSSLF